MDSTKICRGGAITIIPEPESTTIYKFGYHAGKTGKSATIPLDTTEWYRDAYILGYSRGYAEYRKGN